MVQKVLVIAGPTGVGKTRIASLLCKILDGEIISCDSVQVYKGLNIGSNKEIIPGIVQHMIDQVPFSAPFSAADYTLGCLKCISDVLKRGKVPLLVGGTGFYMKWILEGQPKAPATDPLLLEQVKQSLQGFTWSQSLDQLAQCDPQFAASLKPNDNYRLQRALAVFMATGRPMSDFQPTEQDKQEASSNVHDLILDMYDFRCFYMSKNRLSLMTDIDRRCEEMILAGFLEEVWDLKNQGLLKTMTSGRSIGYFQALELYQSLSQLPKDTSLESIDSLFMQFLYNFQTASRSYSRRQDVWFKHGDSFTWLHWDNFHGNEHEFVKAIHTFYNMNKDDVETNEQRHHWDKCNRQQRFEPGKAEKETRTFRTVLNHLDTFEKRVPILLNLQKTLND